MYLIEFRTQRICKYLHPFQFTFPFLNDCSVFVYKSEYFREKWTTWCEIWSFLLSDSSIVTKTVKRTYKHWNRLCLVESFLLFILTVKKLPNVIPLWITKEKIHSEVYLKLVWGFSRLSKSYQVSIFQSYCVLRMKCALFVSVSLVQLRMKHCMGNRKCTKNYR